MCLKYIKGMLSPNITLHSYFLIAWQSFYGKERNRWRNFFSSSGNANCSILLKYKETHVQIQTLPTEIENT